MNKKGNVSIFVVFSVLLIVVIGVVGYYWTIAHTGLLYCGGFIPENGNCPLGNVCSRRGNPSLSTGKCFPASLFEKSKIVSRGSLKSQPDSQTKNEGLSAVSRKVVIGDFEIEAPIDWQLDVVKSQLGPLTYGYVTVEGSSSTSQELMEGAIRKAVRTNGPIGNISPVLLWSEPKFINKILTIQQTYKWLLPDNPENINESIVVIPSRGNVFWIQAGERTDTINNALASLKAIKPLDQLLPDFLISYDEPPYKFAFPATFSFSANTEKESVEVEKMTVDMENSRVIYGRPYGATFYIANRASEISDAINIDKLETIGVGDMFNISSSERYPTTYTRVADIKISGITSTSKRFINKNPLEMPGIREDLILAEFGQKKFKMGGFYKDPTEEKAYREILSSLKFDSQ